MMAFEAKSARKRNCRSQVAGVRQSEMDANVWGNFPGELMEIVLARLPIPFLALVKFRSVCKSWNALLSSGAFLAKIYHIRQIEKTQHESGLLTGRVMGNTVALYAPSLKKWHIAILPWLEMRSPDCDVLLKPSMGGLVCLTKYSWTKLCNWGWIIDVLVWNPFTNDCRQLPPATRYSVWEGGKVESIVYVNYTTKEYKVMLVEVLHEKPDYGKIFTEIYDSPTNTWKICDSGLSRQTKLRLTCKVEKINICCDSLIYFITRKLGSITKELHTGILVFEMKTEVWREIKVQPIQDEKIENPHFVELYNKVYMVAHLVRDKSVRIWGLLEHADGRGQWIKADRLPGEFVELLDPTGLLGALAKTQWRCTGSGDSLLFEIWEEEEDSGFVKFNLGLVYSVCTRSWSRVPPCDLENEENEKDAWYRGLDLTQGWVPP